MLDNDSEVFYSCNYIYFIINEFDNIDTDIELNWIKIELNWSE